MAEPRLSYVALISRDVPAARRLLGDVLGLARTFIPGMARWAFPGGCPCWGLSVGIQAG